ncbi:hypothetical protein [Rufibacter hautae]|uniref:Uncharacterized protein n=1 Tax=Rufibacter hautae TaxID=2595005 RepID=A0A5B6TJH3_9BACT|nr:hypothetical protein [Rufibacter hautae]KAA3439515.1 hypothetical protein FOA19_02165 [Rufibacter hautae]
MAGSKKDLVPWVGTPKIENLRNLATRTKAFTGSFLIDNTNPVNNTFEFIWSGALNPMKSALPGGLLYGNPCATSGGHKASPHLL